MFEDIWLLIIRTLGVYIAIFIVFRLMGKREIGELSVMDLVVFIMLAEIAIFSIENTEDSFFLLLTPMLVLLVVQRFTAFLSLKSNRFREFLDGRPSVIIRNGKINEREMKRQRYNMDDLLVQLRENGIIDLREIELAILETSGKLSVFEKKDHPPSIIEPVIIDGEIQQRTLEKYNLTKEELIKMFESRGVHDFKQISLAQLNDDHQLFIDIKN
ncbi:DUF421 domain-containing protein [Tenuibacillus multivorans]|uniref:Uncharacterized membrane protein YcaP, DUF421 family n=1 Tax=Tenuibacillus multivorans TaxID=237069 RepID=A0A1G9ZJ54_9BACI|nr:DUF421 domain-containing protein [Tenuibacillus multivorans]GEL77478.1 DUF421 domain-containing protein [Tenuibacillus multivorans]SDN21358.1 Uncharacterized membrane protein YcaP, DUF421 family [Tenuibacillus multivorans]